MRAHTGAGAAAAHPKLPGPSCCLERLPWFHEGQEALCVGGGEKAHCSSPNTQGKEMFSPLPRAGGMELLALARMSLVQVKELYLWPPSMMWGSSVTGVHSPHRDLCCPGPPRQSAPRVFEYPMAGECLGRIQELPKTVSRRFSQEKAYLRQCSFHRTPSARLLWSAGGKAEPALSQSPQSCGL